MAIGGITCFPSLSDATLNIYCINREFLYSTFIKFTWREYRLIILSSTETSEVWKSNFFSLQFSHLSGAVLILQVSCWTPAIIHMVIYTAHWINNGIKPSNETDKLGSLHPEPTSNALMLAVPQLCICIKSFMLPRHIHTDHRHDRESLPLSRITVCVKDEFQLIQKYLKSSWHLNEWTSF